jgi:uncharacterized protein (DUF2235 family)
MKRLVICCDGTWQSLGRDRLTNVALAARAVSPRDADGNPQIVYYGAGVGVSLDKLNLYQGAFGAGLDQHLLEAYLFLALNYEPGDQIYLIGFSRGAYTARSLAGFIRKCGVLYRRCADKAEAALALYRSRDIGVDSDEAAQFRSAFSQAQAKLPAKGMRPLVNDPGDGPSYDLRLAYIGVWDTVGALGVPRMLPFARGFNKKFEFHDLELSRSVLAARHAVSIDERRNAFGPTLWSNIETLNRELDAPRYEQKWFPGDHGGVGGGDKARGLSNCAFAWIMEGAARQGLAIDRSRGSVWLECEAGYDPVRPPVRDGGFSISALALMGYGPRRGVKSIHDLSDAARARWAARRDYRPGALRRLRRALRSWAERRSSS